MNKKLLIKIISLIAVACIAVSVCVPSGFASGADTKPSLEERRDELQRKLLATEKKLSQFNKQSRETEEYIEALGEKIQYLSEQYKIAKDETKSIELKVAALEKNITSNEREIKEISAQTAELEKKIINLNEEFSSVYKEYCGRMRAIYISGQQGSVITFLLASDGVSNLLTRLQMVSAVSKRDGLLLQEVQRQTGEIMSVKNQLDEKNTELKRTQKKLKKNKKDLKAERVSLLKSQEEMAAQQAVIEAQQEEQNVILQELHNKTKQYGEFRDMTQEELDEIDADIEAADRRYRETTTTTTTTKKRTTTTTTTTTEPSSTEEGETTESTTKKKTTTTTTTTTTQSSSYIKLTYPCPRYTTITCGFGAYSGHTGCDFSTHGNENQKIVAAESGTVILVKLLERSYGHYIVIRHDKTTSSGKSVYTLYAHNNDIIVDEGQYVKKGQKIANSGSTGNSTGPHCHFEVRVGGSGQSYAQDPAIYLP